MALHPVDFHRALVVDLPLGRINLRDDDRVLALPSSWLGEVLTFLNPSAIEALAVRLAEALHRAVSAQTDDMTTLQPDEAAFALSSVMALRGMGTAVFEGWGDSLVLVWKDAPCEGQHWEAFATRLLAKTFDKLTSLPVDTTCIGRNDRVQRYLIGTSETCKLVRDHLARGNDWASAVSHLAVSDET